MSTEPIQRIEENDEVNKYYDKLIQHITEDWQNQKYQAAIDRIQEELDQPYIPYEYENILSDLLYSYERELKMMHLDEHLKNLSANDMLVEINKNGKFNIFLFELFMQKYGEHLEKPQLAILQLWLQDKVILNTEKFFILDCLAEANVDQNFIFYNANTDDDVVLNPLTYRDNEALQPYDEASKLVNDQTFKDPVVNNFANDVMSATAYYYFPSFPFSSTENLSNAVLNVISNSLNMLEVNPAQLSEDEKLVNKVIESIAEYEEK